MTAGFNGGTTYWQRCLDSFGVFLQDMCNDWWQGNKYSADNLDEADLESCVMMREGYRNLLDQ